jgi:tetratricopeptide (TPR) repeat protein
MTNRRQMTEKQMTGYRKTRTAGHFNKGSISMMRRIWALSLLALVTPVLALSAQAKPGAPAAAAAAPPADPCPVDLMQPTGLAIANLQRSKLANVKSVDDANKVMKDVSKLLFDAKQNENPKGRDLLLAEFITFYIQYADSAKRGDIGFPGDKNQYVDMLKYADSLFTIIETAEPKCRMTTLQWRNYKPYSDRIKAAYAAAAAGAADTAEKLANRAMILNHGGPQPYDVLWRVAKLRKDEAHEIQYLQTAADKLVGDTANAAVRANFLFTLGRIQQEFADAKTDKAAKDKLYRDAATAYMQVLKEFPSSDEAQYSMQGISISANILSDTSISNAAVAIVKAAPDKFSDATLAQAGVFSTTAGKTADAVMFFQAAVKLNPYSREYLYYLAAMLASNKQWDDMVQTVHKLIAVDPSNPDDYQLFTIAFKGVSDNSKDPAVKKWAIDSIQYYGKVVEEMPHRVAITDLERQPNRTLMSGTVENRAKDPRSFSIDFEFVGKDGSVLQKSTATVANVAPGATGNFKIDIPIGGVYGVRYAALPLK